MGEQNKTIKHTLNLICLAQEYLISQFHLEVHRIYQLLFNNEFCVGFINKSHYKYYF